MVHVPLIICTLAFWLRICTIIATDFCRSYQFQVSKVSYHLTIILCHRCVRLDNIIIAFSDVSNADGWRRNYCCRRGFDLFSSLEIIMWYLHILASTSHWHPSNHTSSAYMLASSHEQPQKMDQSTQADWERDTPLSTHKDQFWQQWNGWFNIGIWKWLHKGQQLPSRHVYLGFKFIHRYSERRTDSESFNYPPKEGMGEKLQIISTERFEPWCSHRCATVGFESNITAENSHPWFR